MDHIAGNIAEIRERMAAAALRAGREPGSVTLIAVTKTHPASAVRAALDAGITDIGENKVQEAVAKFAEVVGNDRHDDRQECLSHGGFRRHLIGHLQTNKAKVAVREFDLIHAVDSLRLAAELDRHATALGRPCSVLLEVNVSGEESKFGFTPSGLDADFDAIVRLSSVRVDGLMTMAPFVEDEAVLRGCFRALRELAASLGERAAALGAHFGPHLSMGMTNDFEIAIEEGSTLVRVGTAIFGRREAAAD